MQPEAMRMLRTEAEKRLFEYRQSCGVLRAASRGDRPARSRKTAGAGRPFRAKELAAMRCWKHIIEKTQRYYAEVDPEMERFMVRYFALNAPLNRRMPRMARHYEIMAEFNISDSSVYKWKAKVIDTTLAYAAESKRLHSLWEHFD